MSCVRQNVSKIVILCLNSRHQQRGYEKTDQRSSNKEHVSGNESIIMNISVL